MYLQFKKSKSICCSKLLVHPIQLTRSTYLEAVLKLRISQRYVHTLERNWKSSVCICVIILLIYKFLSFTAVFSKNK